LTVDPALAHDTRVQPLIPRREHFTGPERLSPAWTLMKGRKTASCVVA